MSSRSYPIWHEVTACNYQSSKSYGSLETAGTRVLVGSGSNHSHNLVRHWTTRRERHGWIVFSFGFEKFDGENWIDMGVQNRCWIDPDDMSRVLYHAPQDYLHRQKRNQE